MITLCKKLKCPMMKNNLKYNRPKVRIVTKAAFPLVQYSLNIWSEGWFRTESKVVLLLNYFLKQLFYRRCSLETSANTDPVCFCLAQSDRFSILVTLPSLGRKSYQLSLNILRGWKQTPVTSSSQQFKMKLFFQQVSADWLAFVSFQLPIIKGKLSKWIFILSHSISDNGVDGLAFNLIVQTMHISLYYFVTYSFWKLPSHLPSL